MRFGQTQNKTKPEKVKWKSREKRKREGRSGRSLCLLSVWRVLVQAFKLLYILWHDSQFSIFLPGPCLHVPFIADIRFEMPWTVCIWFSNKMMRCWFLCATSTINSHSIWAINSARVKMLACKEEHRNWRWEKVLMKRSFLKVNNYFQFVWFCVLFIVFSQYSLLRLLLCIWIFNSFYVVWLFSHIFFAIVLESVGLNWEETNVQNVSFRIQKPLNCVIIA